MTQLNVNQICSITQFNKRINHNYKYVPAYSFKSWFITKYYEGRFVRDGIFDHSDITLEEILKNNPDCYVEDNKIYYYPYLFFRMSNGSTYDKHFNTVLELEEFLNQKILMHIKVILECN